jgi:molecular chaperone GrpE
MGGEKMAEADQFKELEKTENIEEEKQEENKIQGEFERMSAIIDNIEEEKKELKDKYLRALANYENLRKRAIQEKDKIYNFTLEEVFRQILPILDDFRRAFKSLEESKEHKDDFQSFSDGIRLVYSNLNNLLINYNIESFESVGHKFDPSKHEAIHVIEKEDEEDDIIVEETEVGYKIKDKILRPAKVIVVKNNQKNQNKNENNNQGGRTE